MDSEKHFNGYPPDESGNPLSTATASDITFILITVSLLIVLGTAFFKVDFVPGVLLGCLVVVLNFYLTRRILSRLLMFKDLKRRMLVLYLLKLGLSGIVLYLAIVHFRLPGLAVLIGLSNILITMLVFVIKRTLYPSLQLPRS